MRPNNNLTIQEVANLVGMHPNTIRNYVKAGRLQATKIMIDNVETWVIERDHLYSCGVPKIMARLGPQDVDLRDTKLSTQPYVVPDKWLDEITRLSRENGELLRNIGEVTAENEIIRFKAEKLLPATTQERDQLRAQVEEVRGEREELRRKAEALATEVELKSAALEQAWANAKWSWRRRMKKAVGE